MSEKHSFKSWKAYKSRVNELNRNREVRIEDLQILESKGIYIVQFLQRFSSSNTKDTGVKTLYIEKDGLELKIISELWEQQKTSETQNTLKFAYKPNQEETTF